MDFVFILSMIIIITCVFLMWFVGVHNAFQGYVIKINEAEANIDSILRKRFDLLNKSISIIKANIESEEDVLESIVKLRSRKLTNFDLDRQIYDAINEFNSFKVKFPNLNQIESFSKINGTLEDTEVDILAGRKYYNDIITDYNILIRKIPSNMVAMILKYKYRPYFDGKDMTDEIINDFKL